MTRVLWGDAGTRFFETGVDRGVLYLSDQDGVAWNGLTSVEESPSGGEAKPYYQDGVKFLNVATREEFAANIEAFSAPAEFGVCDGTVSIQNGLFVTQQPRRAFSLSYRTMIGNDLDPLMGYKIHLVYNALAGPSSRSNATMSDSPEATTLSWSLTTLPPSFTGYKPTAHLVIDSRKTPKGLLAAIEDILYGSDVADARIPFPSELISMFQSEGPVTRTNYATNPGFRTYGGYTTEVRRNLVTNPAFKTIVGTGEIRRNLCTNPNFEANNTTGWANYSGCATLAASTSAAYSGTYGMRVTVDGTSAIPRVSWTMGTGVLPNESFSMTVRTRVVTGTGWAGNAAPYFVLRGTKTTGGEWTATTIVTSAADANGWRYVTITGIADAATNGSLVVNIGWNNGVVPANTAQFDVDLVSIERSQVPMPYFDGSTPAADGLTYSWVGTANASASIASGSLLSTATLKGYTRPTWAVAGGATDGTNSMLTYVGLMSSAASPINTLLLFSYDGPLADPGQTVSARFRARLRNAAASISISPRLFAYTSGGSGLSNISTGAVTVIPADGSWVDVIIPGGVLPATAAQARFYINAYTLPEIQNSAIFEVSNALIEKTDMPLPWFDGNTPAADGLTYSWTSTANGSPAIATGKAAATVASTANTPIWQGADGESLRVLSKYGTSGFFEVSSSMAVPVVDGDVVTVSFDVSSDVPSKALLVTAQTGTAQNTNGPIVDIGTTPIRMSLTSLPAVGATMIRPLFFPQTNGVIYTIDNMLLEKASGPLPYFDGSSVDSDNYFYYWDGAADASTSHVNTWN